MPRVIRLTADRVTLVAHQLCTPAIFDSENNHTPVTLPERVPKLYLALDDWGLRPLRGITGAPLLMPDGTIRAVNGYDPASGLWCTNIPAVDVPERSTSVDAAAALQFIQLAFCTFPFADARLSGNAFPPVVDLTQPPHADESAFIVALLTAVCRPSLPLVPGLCISAPTLSGAGTGKGLLARSICAIAFGSPPYAMTSSGKADELEKRIVAALIEARPVLFLDNVNRGLPRSDLLASILTEQHVSVRPLGGSQSLSLTPNTLVIITGNTTQQGLIVASGPPTQA